MSNTLATFRSAIDSAIDESKQKLVEVLRSLLIGHLENS